MNVNCPRDPLVCKCDYHLGVIPSPPPSVPGATLDAAYHARARFNAQLASRACCRAHGTTCPACRAWDYRAPRLLVRLRDLLDALRAWCSHG